MPSKTPTPLAIDCPCGSSLPFTTCCYPFIAGISHPETAQSLMKARYSAFATAKTLGDIAIDFLWNTWAPDKGSKGDEAEIKNWALSCKWLSLNIDNTYQGAKGDSYGEVVFTARYKQQGRLLIHNEHSVFRHVDGQWLYVAHLPVQPET